MSSEKPDRQESELIDAVDESRRSLIKRLLLGGAAAYAAPVIASFSLTESAAFAGGGPLGSNQHQFNVCHPVGGNQGRIMKATPGHLGHGDQPTYGPEGAPCHAPDKPGGHH